MKTVRHLGLHLGLGILFFLFVSPVTAQVFTEMPALSNNLEDVWWADVEWGDYDNDGDLDILLQGVNSMGVYLRVYRNNGSSFQDINAGLPSMAYGSAAWGDYDNDGDLDILFIGMDGFQSESLVYRNDNGQFNLGSADLLDVSFGSAAWGDYDNDGDLDVLFAGEYEDTDIGVAGIYRNDAGNFQGVVSFLGVNYSSVAWGDYDGDGDLDALVMGEYYSSYDTANIYRNDGGIFTDIGANLPEIKFGDVDWGDYDHDGDLDILLMGSQGVLGMSKIYRNDAGTFVDINANLDGAYFGDADWGDYDNDGDLDILLTGYGPGVISRVYRNDSGIFTNINAGLAGVYTSSAAWGDYDNDGDLDIVLAGDDGNNVGLSKIYRNNTITPNTPPAPPSSFGGILLADTAILFTWTAALDATTPQLGLSYRLWIGTATDSFNVSAPMADTTTGWRRIAAIGNIQGTGWTLQDVTFGETYFACVSTIDAGFMGSPCSNTTSMLVGMEELGSGKSILVTAGPNPTTDFIHISIHGRTSQTAIQYALVNMEGQELAGFSGTMDAELQLDLSSLPSGMYHLQLRSRNGQCEGLKIIKQ